MTHFVVTAVEGPLYDNKLTAHGTHFTQSSLYRQWQEDRGFTVERFVLKENEQPVLFFQTITAPLIFGKNQLYIPHGPVALINEISLEAIAEFKKSLQNIAKIRRAIFVRFDPKTPDLFDQMFGRAPRLAYHSTLTQPRYEWILDISATTEKLFDTLPKDTRYSIRTSERRGAEVKTVTENFSVYLEDFYRLLEATAARNNFRPHPRAYYQKVLAETEKAKGGFLVVSSFDGQPLTINLVTIFGATALHIFGGSSSEHRDKLPSYLAHWAGFKEAKRRGATKYSFGGISHGEDQKENWADITAFKKNFPGTVMDFGPLYDFPISRLWYYLYILGKLIRK